MSGAETLELEELLRKCHRAELIPVAEVLTVRHEQLPLDKLASAIARRLRRRGANDLMNIVLRAGEGPDYDEVVFGLGARLGLTMPNAVADGERLVVEHYVEQHWAALPEAEQEAIWEELGADGSVPETGAEVVESSIGVQGAVRALSVGASTALSKVPPAGCLFLYWLMRPRDELVWPSVVEIAKLRTNVERRVTVGVVGSPSSGKDAAIKAIFGIDSGNVNPVAGSTKEVEIARLEGSTALFVVNTPGMGDVVESVTEAARQVLDHIDVYVYVVNAQGGVQAREKSDYDLAVASGRPVAAVVNKVDTLRESDRERYLADARAKLGASEADFFAAAFDPLPQLSEHPIGVDALRVWLAAKLVAMGKQAEELPWVGAAVADGAGALG